MLAATSMRLELEKMASRRVEIFQALLKRMPKDVAVLEMGKTFPLKVSSPFVIEGDGLRQMLTQAGDKGLALVKSIRPEKRYVVVPSPEKTGRIMGPEGPMRFAPYTALAHEMGHVIGHDEGEIWQGKAPNVIQGLTHHPLTSMAVGGLAGSIAGSPGTGALAGAAASGLLAGLGNLPLIYRERQASNRARALMQEVGLRPSEMRRASEDLGKAGRTYGRAALGDVAGGVIGGGLTGAASGLR